MKLERGGLAVSLAGRGGVKEQAPEAVMVWAIVAFLFILTPLSPLCGHLLHIRRELADIGIQECPRVAQLLLNTLERRKLLIGH